MKIKGLFLVFVLLPLGVSSQGILTLKSGRQFVFKKQLRMGEESVTVKEFKGPKRDIPYTDILYGQDADDAEMHYMIKVPEGGNEQESLSEQSHYFLKVIVEGEVRLLFREEAIYLPGHNPDLGPTSYSRIIEHWYLEGNGQLKEIQFNGEKPLIKFNRKQEERIQEIRDFFNEYDDPRLLSNLNADDFRGTREEVKFYLKEYNVRNFSENTSDEIKEIRVIRTPQFFDSEPVSLRVNGKLVEESFEVNQLREVSFPVDTPCKVCLDDYCEIVRVPKYAAYNLNLIYDPEQGSYLIEQITDYQLEYWEKGIELIRRREAKKNSRN